MDGRRTALIVASDQYEHTGLSKLRAPSADAGALADVLGDPGIGGFDVRVVHNSPSHLVQASIEDLFVEGQPDDLLLLHFSGHGLKSDSGELFFAAPNTRPDRLASTAVSADFVQRCMRGSRARSIVLFLDCCYGGAFSEGVAVRAAGPANVLDSFPAGRLGGGRGRAVITASSAMEYAFEGTALTTDRRQQPSVFTSAVVDGLRSGAADRDEDGLVSLNELYDYVFDQVRAENPNQTPSRDIELQGDLYIAKSHRKRVRPVPLPPDLRAALHDENMYTRLGAVGELRNRLRNVDPGVALGAHQALEDIARSDTSYVAEAALRALADVAVPSAPTPGEARSAPPATPPTSSASTSPSVAPPSFASPAATAAAAPSPATSPPVAAPSAAVKPAQTPVRKPPAQTPPVQTPPPVQAPVVRAPSPRHRATAGRTAITGGSLLVVSAVLPAFVYSDDAFSFRQSVGVTLVLLGLGALLLGACTLWLPQLRRRWPWPLVGLAAAAVAATVALLDATGDLGWSDVGGGLWLALAGGLTVVAAGVVAGVGLRRTEGATTPAPLTRVLRASGWLAVVACALVLWATFAVRFVHGEQAILGPIPVWAWLFPGLAGLGGGIVTLRVGRRPGVGPGLVAGAAAAAVWGLGEMPQIGRSEGIGALNSGYYLELVGLVGLVVAGALALLALHREHTLGWTAALGRSGAAAGVLGALAAVPFLRVARLNWESSLTANAVHDLQIATFAVAVPLLVAGLQPHVVARFALLGWSLGTVGVVLAYWRLLDEAGAPLLGIPYVLAALAGLAAVAVTEPLWRPRT